jgi:hypothetical protein
MDKTLDLDELEKDAHGVLAYHNPSDPTPRVGVRATVLLTLIAAPQPPATNWSEFEDEISDAISDSIDMDWSSRDGARAVVALLNKEAPR